MKRIHFDSTGKVHKHYFFWQPWGCGGCLLRTIGFLILLLIFLFLLSQFRSCSHSRGASSSDFTLPDTAAVSNPETVPPINEDDIIDEDGRRIMGNRLNVLFKAEVGREGIESWIEHFNNLYPGDEYQVLFCDVNTKLMSLQVPSEERRNMMTALPVQIPDIPFIVFEEEVMNVGYTPSDPSIAAGETGGSWHLAAVDAFDGWDYTKGSDVVTVAVVDSYFDLSNPEFANTSIVSPYSVSTGTSDVQSPEFDPANPDLVIAHGTMVANLALGGMDNGHGTAGIAPECNFMPISLSNRFGCLAMLQGILYAINHQAQVINVSAGISVLDEVRSWPVEQQIAASRQLMLPQQTVWKYVFDMCADYDVTIVWAAGNEDIFTAIDASKRGNTTIKVSATDANGNKAEFSNFGNFAEQNIYESTVSAPGAQVYGELPGGQAMAVDGTSFSAPIVAGAVGLMKSLDISLSTAEIIDILQRTGVPSGDTTIGPRIQIGAALDAVVDAFLPFDTLAAICRGELRPYDVVFPTTLKRPLRLPDSDDTAALPPLVQLSFRFAGGADGKVYYTSVDAPSAPWVADIKMTLVNDSTIRIVQSEDAVSAGRSNFDSAEFTVVPDEGGKAFIKEIVSESVPSRYTPFIKKHI